MLSDRTVILLIRQLHQVERYVNDLKTIDKQLSDVTINEKQRMLLLHQKAIIMAKLKNMF